MLVYCCCCTWWYLVNNMILLLTKPCNQFWNSLETLLAVAYDKYIMLKTMLVKLCCCIGIGMITCTAMLYVVDCLLWEPCQMLCCSNLTMPRNLCETCWMLLFVYIMNITNVLISCMLLKSQSMVMLVNQISNLAAASKALSCHGKPYELWTLPLFVLLVE